MRRATLLPGNSDATCGAEDGDGDLVMQVGSWSAVDQGAGDDGEDEDDDADGGDNKRNRVDRGKFTIRAFGVTAKGRSVMLTVEGFTPFFYVKIPGFTVSSDCSRSDVRALQRHLTHEADTIQAGMVDVKHWRKKDFWGFTNGREFDFLRLTFTSLGGMRHLASRLRRPQRVRGIGGGSAVELVAYESNIDPMLRFFHIRDLRPAGWIRVPARRLMPSADRTTCQAAWACKWTDVQPEEQDNIAPLLLASFDIECASSHGDFPMARKDYRKMCLDLEQAWDRGGIKAMPNDYAAKNALLQCMTACFYQRMAADDAPDYVGNMSRVYLKRPIAAKEKLDQAIAAVVDDVYAVLAGKAPPTVLSVHDNEDEDEQGDDGVDITDEGKGLNPRMHKLVTVINRAFNDAWPVRGDEIIQIGTTVNVYGERECVMKCVLTLGTCEPIEGVLVRAFEREDDMLLAWVDLMRDIDPDIVMGYNIFGFDFDYMHTRAEELLGKRACEQRFCRLGRVDAMPSKLIKQELTSSAMGDNVLKYLDLNGRVMVDLMKVVQREHKLDSFKLDAVAHHFMGLNKHDVSPNDIFRLQKGSAADRRIIADYCVQDCALCNQLAAKLEIVANNVGMANVCSVPLAFIFMRGQGVKIFSLVAKQCREDGVLIPAKKHQDDLDEEDGYEGAIVLDPETGMYLNDPVTVLDYNSLYPSSMISENISHDSLVLNRAYGNLPGVEYVDIRYDKYEGKGDEKRRVGESTCRFAQSGGKAVLPRILQRLLGERKATRKRMEHVRITDGNGVELYTGPPTDAYKEKEGIVLEPLYNSFQRAVLDGLQLAYKVTANSLYGQMGARTSQLYLKEVAACTTAVGRAMIMKAKAYIEEECGGRVIYGDTDSIFIVFQNPAGSPRDVLASSIAQGQAASNGIKPLLKAPHNLEYEKTMFPLILLSKKRYVGLLYEKNPDAKPKQKSMGIALKRRDYAPIVKKIYGGVIDIILNDRNFPAAVTFLKRSLADLAEGRYDLQDLVISKTLRSSYKVPQQIAHWVLARRMFERDPGSAPQANDRIPYVFVETSKKNPLMGDRIEHVDHVRRNPSLLVDTKTYIENQIKKPCLQLLSIALEQLPGYKPNAVVAGPNAFATILDAKKGNVQKARERLNTLRESEVDKIIFQPFLSMSVFRQRDNRCANQREIHCYFGPAAV